MELGTTEIKMTKEKQEEDDQKQKERGVRGSETKLKGMDKSSGLWNSLHSWLRPLLQGSIQICLLYPHFEGKCHFHFLIH